jgi:hypothetical protein
MPRASVAFLVCGKLAVPPGFEPSFATGVSLLQDSGELEDLLDACSRASGQAPR